MNIETKHKNYKITFSEERETWSCSDLDIENAKLAAVKRRIDEIGKSERKVNLPVLMASMDGRDRASIKELTVTVLCEPGVVPRYRGGDGEMPTTYQCWVKSKDGSRFKIDISQLIPLSGRAEIEVWARLHREAQAATKLAEQALAAIPRHDADSLILAAKEAAAS